MVRIALIGCGKTKAVLPVNEQWIAARDLYTSSLFRKRVEHVEARGLPWYILSAKNGIVAPSVSVRTYNQTFEHMMPIEIAEWHLEVAKQLMGELWETFELREVSDVTVEIHAGARYCEPLGKILAMFGVNVVKPVQGLGIGEQLAYYGKELV